jgi:hypothetical protein
MVGKKDMNKARQGDREARRRREKRKTYEAMLEEHPAVKAVRSRMAPRAAREPIKRGVPKIIAEATQDSDIATAVATMRRVMRYHHHAGDLVHRRLRRESVPLKDQKALMRQGKNVERDFQQAIRSACKAARANPATEAYAAAIAARPDNTEVIDNLPSFLACSEVAVIRYLGVEPREFHENWRDLYPKNKQRIQGYLASGKINQDLEYLEKSAKRLEFPEAPRHLVARGIITFGGDGGDTAAVAVAVVGVVTAIIGGILCCFPATAAVGAVLVGIGASAIGTAGTLAGVYTREVGVAIKL